MCLIYDPIQQRYLKAKLKMSSKRGKVTVYKYLDSGFHAPIYSYKYKYGWNNSGRSKELTSYEKPNRQVNKGFHVYLTKDQAMSERSRNEQRVVEFKANIDELIAIDYFGYTAVFTRLYLPKPKKKTTKKKVTKKTVSKKRAKK